MKLGIIKVLDKGEKDFVLLALAFVLVAVFLIITGAFSAKKLETTSTKIYVGYKEVNIDEIVLNEIQISTCGYAEEYNSCVKVDDTFIATTQICCKKLGKCCS